MSPRMLLNLKTPWVALLGPDGSGKSSVIQNLEPLFAPPLVAGVKVSHRRPKLIGPSQKTVHVPGTPVKHFSNPPHGLIKSLVKITILALDWLTGYWGKIMPQRAAGYLVIFDRYYWLDLMVAPLRYRYNGPTWLLQLAKRILPGPNLVILLDAPVEVLQERKQEVSPEESARQRAVYLEIVQSMPNGYIVDASNPLDQVVAEVQQIILNYIEAWTKGSPQEIKIEHKNNN